MSFSDEDLKRLKEHLDGPHTQVAWYAPVVPDNLRALVARLEAAERVVKAHPKLENEQISYDDFNSLVAMWAKAAGK